MTALPNVIVISIVSGAACLGSITGTVVTLMCLARRQAHRRQREADVFMDANDSSLIHGIASDPDFAKHATTALVAHKLQMLARINRRRLWGRGLA